MLIFMVVRVLNRDYLYVLQEMGGHIKFQALLFGHRFMD